MHNRSMIYGYARVSSNGQDLAQQLAQLDAAGCTKIYREKVSAATAERPQLKRAIGALDAGDVLMVTATDRLARHTRDLLAAEAMALVVAPLVAFDAQCHPLGLGACWYDRRLAFRRA